MDRRIIKTSSFFPTVPRIFHNSVMPAAAWSRKLWKKIVLWKKLVRLKKPQQHTYIFSSTFRKKAQIRLTFGINWEREVNYHELNYRCNKYIKKATTTTKKAVHIYTHKHMHYYLIACWLVFPRLPHFHIGWLSIFWLEF